MKIRNSSIFLFIICLLLLGCTPARSTPPAASENYLFFRSNRDGGEKTYLWSLESGNIAAFRPEGVPANASVSIPVWSESQKKYYATVVINDKADIISFDKDGKNTVNLTASHGFDAYETNPVPSPDGRTIAYESFINKAEIWVMDANGKNPKNLTVNYPDSSLPAWSPDGKYIYFSSSIEGTPNIFRITNKGEDLVNISNGKGLDGVYSLTADQLVFDSDRDGAMDIFLVNLNQALNEENITNITKSPAREVEPKISPDGKKVLYRSQITDGWDYYVLDLDSGKQTQVTDSPDVAKSNSVWSSDSNTIYFNMYAGDHLDIFSYDLEAGKLTNLTNTPESDDYAPTPLTFSK
jgi:Tol biopolymer transport system component